VGSINLIKMYQIELRNIRGVDKEGPTFRFSSDVVVVGVSFISRSGCSP
jgi:hypothetical protein